MDKLMSKRGVDDWEGVGRENRDVVMREIQMGAQMDYQREAGARARVMCEISNSESAHSIMSLQVDFCARAI